MPPTHPILRLLSTDPKRVIGLMSWTFPKPDQTINEVNTPSDEKNGHEPVDHGDQVINFRPMSGNIRWEPKSVLRFIH